jgi:hypothetical protein
MRMLVCFAATLVVASCSSNVGHTRAPDVASGPSYAGPLMTLELRDGAHIAYSPAYDDFASLTPPQGGVIRCVEATGEIRWAIAQPAAQAESATDSNPLAGAFYIDPDQHKKPVELTWGDAAHAADDLHLYRVQFNRLANGANVVALSLRSGDIVWSSWVLGIGQVTHSRYSNQVEARIENGTLVIYGDEAGGDYVEVFSAQGKRLSTKIVGDG